MPPAILYARTGATSVAYQVVGEDPPDLLMIPGWISHLALEWEEPTWVRWCERMTSFARLVRFDKRGTGLSDRPPGVATLEERMEDARAVLDAVGLERAHVMGWSEGGPLAVLLAVMHPERVQSLTLYGTQACFHLTDDYPWGDPERSREDDLREVEQAWGSLAFAETFAPRCDRRFCRMVGGLPACRREPVRRRRTRACELGDRRSAARFPRFASPTLVLSRRGDPIGPPDAARDTWPSRSRAARFVELEGDDHILWLGDVEALCGEIEHFITGIRPARPEPGAVTTILQCDVEGSTRLARELGDESWADLLGRYGRIADLAVTAGSGRIVDRTGDGLMASFPGPVAAVRAAQRLQREAERARHPGPCRRSHRRGSRAERRPPRDRSPPGRTGDGEGVR